MLNQLGEIGIEIFDAFHIECHLVTKFQNNFAEKENELIL